MNAGTLYGKYLNAEPQELVQQGAILQDLVRRYPWFSLGRLLLFKSLCGLGGEASLSESEKTAAYVYSRSKLYFIRQESLQMEEQQAEIDFFTLDLKEIFIGNKVFNTHTTFAFNENLNRTIRDP